MEAVFLDVIERPLPLTQCNKILLQIVYILRKQIGGRLNENETMEPDTGSFPNFAISVV
jgi:hypothetical protein